MSDNTPNSATLVSVLELDGTGDMCIGCELNAATDISLALLRFPADSERFFKDHTDIMTLIYNELSLLALMVFSFTQKEIFLDVANYQAKRILRLLLPFHICYDQFLNALQTSGVIVVGSFALLCSIPLSNTFSINSIDFVIPGSLHPLEFLKTIVPNVSFTPKAENLGPFSPGHPVKSSYSFSADLNGQAFTFDFNVMVIGLSENTSVYKTLFYSPTSCGMHALSGHGIFCAYRQVLASSIGIVNHVYCSSLFQDCQDEDIARQLRYNNVSQHKYISRGFSFPNPHFLHQPSAICEKNFLCPSTIWNARSWMCSYAHILQLW